MIFSLFIKNYILCYFKICLNIKYLYKSFKNLILEPIPPMLQKPSETITGIFCIKVLIKCPCFSMNDYFLIHKNWPPLWFFNLFENEIKMWFSQQDYAVSKCQLILKCHFVTAVFTAKRILERLYHCSKKRSDQKVV